MKTNKQKETKITTKPLTLLDVKEGGLLCRNQDFTSSWGALEEFQPHLSEGWMNIFMFWDAPSLGVALN